MVKIVCTFKKNPALTEEQCDKHYRTVHTALARLMLQKVPGFRKYVQNKVVSTTVVDFNDSSKSHPGEPDFEWAVDFYFDTIEDLARAYELPEMQACFNDHKNFMDTDVPANIKIYQVEETVALKRDEYTGQMCYPWTPADEPPFKEQFQRAIADREAGKPWSW